MNEKSGIYRDSFDRKLGLKIGLFPLKSKLTTWQYVNSIEAELRSVKCRFL